MRTKTGFSPKTGVATLIFISSPPNSTIPFFLSRSCSLQASSTNSSILQTICHHMQELPVWITVWHTCAGKCFACFSKLPAGDMMEKGQSLPKKLRLHSVTLFPEYLWGLEEGGRIFNSSNTLPQGLRSVSQQQPWPCLWHCIGTLAITTPPVFVAECLGILGLNTS